MSTTTEKRVRPRIPRATGSVVTPKDLAKPRLFSVLDFGASPDASPASNQKAINAAIRAAADAGGGTVTIPEGRFETYTVVLASNVNLRIDRGATLASGRYAIREGVIDFTGEGFAQEGQDGNSLEPEVNRYVGLQDHAHSYLRNCLIWGDRVRNAMIYGEGLIDGSWVDEHGVRHDALAYADPQDPPRRDQPGYTTEWFGNKGIALFDCAHIVLRDFSMLMGGHFAIIATGTDDLLVENLTVDTNRDGIDIDSVADCTVRGCTFNTMHDDAIVVKSSYGAQRFKDSHNILIEDCTVCGYDIGSVLAGNPTTDRQACYPAMGPIGRVKLGTEATGGYSLVTIRNIRFRRCTGLALEAVDGSDMTDIVAENLEMDGVTACPVFIRVGDRARFPVTGHGTDQLRAPEGDVRLDEPEWVLPNLPGEYDVYPVRRYVPSYRRVATTFDGGRTLTVVDQRDPVHVNPANFTETDGVRHPYRYDETAHAYVPDESVTLTDHDVLCMGNAVGAARPARCERVEITNVKARDVDPRYAIIVAGCVDGRIRDLRLTNVDVTFRGGYTLRDAAEQRFVRTDWTFGQTDLARETTPLDWFVQQDREYTMPRVRFDAATGEWVDDPYNVPEAARAYPEPVQFGITPAYGMYVRHADDVVASNVRLRWNVEDTRPAVVLDDVHGVRLERLDADAAPDVPAVVEVEHRRKRRTCFEFVPEEPYFATRVEDAAYPADTAVERVTIDNPEAATPPDSLYPHPTLPSLENGYRYATPNADRPLPRTAYLPYFLMPSRVDAAAGEELALDVTVRDPLPGAGPMAVRATGLPDGAAFDGRRIVWTPADGQRGVHHARLAFDVAGTVVEHDVAIVVR
ncbi:hypothetical protein G1C96_1702 [Bifidobacterium sp. DSM 109958]|uniref:Right handed beta helix domain-containing protein n=1 Tax=Bifidobacterium moraviense TaxID=2675323 RepID=A0A7Y0HZS6_9BIFI|nr:right-handed parallel beta-helix repeat-containing protein [Bifidobacterium sp. DSM 109958]NMN01119.1 hypothetical protein [Bifidobacterium sp. DSM 109958]